MLAFTADVPAARPCGLVTGCGTAPDTALTAMRQQAKEQGEAIVRSLWAQQGLQKLITSGKPTDPVRKLVGTFSIGSVRLAAGQVNGSAGWVAYGTLLVDGGGEGVEWLRPPEPAPEPGRGKGRRRAGR